jgi:hypothetical protein
MRIYSNLVNFVDRSVILTTGVKEESRKDKLNINSKRFLTFVRNDKLEE